MRTPDSEMDTLIAALRSDLPTADDDARVRARLAAAGAVVGAGLIGGAALNSTALNGGAGAAALTQAVTKTAAAVVGGVQSAGAIAPVVGTWSVGGGLGVKVLVFASAVAAAGSYPLVSPLVSSLLNRVDSGAPVHQPGPAQVVGAANKQAEARSAVDRPEPVVAPAQAVALLHEAVSLRTEAEIATSIAPASGARLVRNSGAQNAVAKPAVKAASAEPVAADDVAEVNTLATETLLIERALRAQKSGDQTAAKHWLSLHQQQFPNGKLTKERSKISAQLQD